MAASAQPSTSGAQPPKQGVMKYAVVLSALAVFGTFTASGVVMKIAPWKGLLPGDTNKDILAAWKKFAALNETQMVLKPLKMDATTFMLSVATLDLLVPALLVIPYKNNVGTKLAGLWVMVSMIGAEFCTRSTAYVPAGFPKEFKALGAGILTATHLAMFLFGACLVFSKHQGTLVQMLNELMAAFKKKAPTEEKTNEEQRGRSEQSDGKASKRDSTPKPNKKAGESPPSPTKSPRGRPSSKR